MMAKKILYVTLAGVLMLFSSCAEDLVGESVLATEKHFGEEILFGGSASYNVNGGTKNGTRTVYGGYEEGATAEPVYWISTDEVRLYSPEAAVKTADYTVSSADGTQASTGLNKKGDVGLQWGNPTGKHTFYGVYPIPADNSLKEGTTLTGNIPNIQIANKVETSGNITTYQPNMDYAYMVARTEITNPNAIGSEVYMKFTPIATAVEIELTLSSGNNAVELRQVNLTSENHYLSGDFSANLENMTLPTTGDVNAKYATVCPNNITYGNNVSKSVGISLVNGNETLTLAAGKTVKFTIFMLPSTNGAADNDAINDLKITLISNSGQQKEGKLNGISIKKSKKTYMHSIPLKGEFTYNQAEWLKYVENSKELNALSIPGAGGASSGNIYGQGVDNYIEQSLSIENLWKTGIRCFEFTVDKHDTDNGNIGEVNVYCNAQDTKMTLDACVSEVKRLLGLYPEEFAMVIITYQQKSGWNKRQSGGTVEQTRNPATWMTQLNTYWTNLQMPTGTRKALYHQGKTVEEARGSLFCIARPTSNGEDNYAVITMESWRPGLASGYKDRIASTTYAHTIATPVVTDPNILVIHGWGALKDKWYARGFTDCIYHRGNGWSAFQSALGVEQCKTAMGYNANRPGRPFDTATKLNDEFTTLSEGDWYSNVDPTEGRTTDLALESNFYYSTVCQEHATPQSNAAWVQEWARVCENTMTYTIESGKYVKWIESKTEKEYDIKECLEKALDDASGNVIYINSLCGYYITNDVPKSIHPNSLTDYNISYENLHYWGTNYYYIQPAELSTMSSDAGMCGDIANFASDMNSYFLDQLQSKLDEDKRLAGSTGIVLMDRVSNTGAGAEISSIIIANNFAPNYNVSDPEVPTTDYVEGDTPASRDNGAVVWGEWED
ncbi:MAG: hypothetical protein J6S07_01085 [Bacteroidaceae bacterium]|nr:hypothetical protein [Bacteroidaceae bacterium]